MNYKFIIIAILSAVLFISCSDDTTKPNEEIDKKALLVNYADNLIIPAYSELYEQSKVLKDRFEELKNNYSDSLSSLIRVEFGDLQIIWGRCSMYGFGPANEIQLRQAINTFPTDTSLIEENIESGSYSLATSANFKAKGLPAIEYLLHPSEITSWQEYYDNEKMLNYISDLIDDVHTNISYVYNKWSDYRDKFVNNTGNDAGSSLSIMINDYVFDYEIAKRAKVGIPSGIFGSVLPYNFEAPHSNLSATLLHNNLLAYKLFITGPANNDPDKTDNMKEYLDAISANRNDSELSTMIIEELDESIAMVGAFKNPMHKMVQNPTGKSEIDALYKNMQEMVVLIKTDMTSAMGILISYQDNDGD